MRLSLKRVLSLLTLLFIIACATHGQQNRFPLKISHDQRYFVDQQGVPFFWQAETPWLIFQNLAPSDISTLIEIRKKQGFTMLQVMALPENAVTGKNCFGKKPFFNLDLSKPDTAYFGALRAGIKIALNQGMAVAMNPIWKGCCGGGWDTVLLKNGTQNCREYGRFLGRYFKDCPNLLWIQGGDNDPREQTDHYRQIALGILDSDPAALQTYHASSGHSSTDMLPAVDHKWLNFSFTYTYFPQKKGVWLHETGFGTLPEVYQMNHREYQKIPVMPFVLGEAQYESERSAGINLSSAEIVRRQAWWAMLSGACGHAYGSWNWTVGKNWRNVEQDSGAWQMRWVKSFFETVPWYKLIPDTKGEIIASGAGIYGSGEYLAAASTADHRTTVVYLPPVEKQVSEFTVNHSYISKNSALLWFDPTSGKFIKAQQPVLVQANNFRIKAPGKNSAGNYDWVLLIQKRY